MQRLYFDPLPDMCAPHPISKDEPGHSEEKTHQPLVFMMSFFWTLPITTTTGWNEDGAVNLTFTLHHLLIIISGSRKTISGGCGGGSYHSIGNSSNGSRSSSSSSNSS